ncbi:MAG: NAD(P)-binding protein [Magnetococcales bacterium]|nr:NAD(P)-binding protein [Magnetococcales bacterium]
MSTHDILILGGGVAGMAAAVAAIGRGLRPLLLESSRQLGGRARSFYAPALGEEVDNGPHLLVGACHHTLDLLTTIGSRHLVKSANRVQYTFWNSSLGWHQLSCPDWPAPWHVLAGLWQFPGLNWQDRLVALRIGGDCLLLPASLAQQSVTQWLFSRGQTQALFQRFWSPLCLAILNEPPGSANARLFARVLADAFFKDRGGAIPLTITCPLSDLFARPCENYILAHGGEIQYGRRVTDLTGDDSQLLTIGTNQGSIHQPPPTLCALPMTTVGRLLPAWREEEGWDVLNHAPIVSVHLHYEQPTSLPAPLVGVPEMVSQWLLQRPSRQPGTALSAVLSGAYREVHWSEEKLVTTVHQDVGKILPQLANTPPRGHLVIKEHRATLAAWPGVDDHRPQATTRWKNFALAGDWSRTGLPATLEGAVQSGRSGISELVKESGVSSPYLRRGRRTAPNNWPWPFR